MAGGEAGGKVAGLGSGREVFYSRNQVNYKCARNLPTISLFRLNNFGAQNCLISQERVLGIRDAPLETRNEQNVEGTSCAGEPSTQTLGPKP